MGFFAVSRLRSWIPLHISCPALRRLASAQAVTVAGTQITALALPTLAITSLHATAFAASSIFAIDYGMQGFASPFAGVLVDKVLSLRRLLVTLDLVQVVVIVCIPLAAKLGFLSLGLVYAIAGLSGFLAGVTGIGIQAIIPLLTDSKNLSSANASIAGTRAVGQIGGPTLAGWLVQLIGAATAMLADAVSYVGSALLLCSIHHTSSTAPIGPKQRSTAWGALSSGLKVIRSYPVLARLAVTTAALNLGGAGLGGLYLYFAYRVAHLTPAQVGITFAIFSVAAVVAASTASRVIKHIGLDRIVPTFAPIAAGSLFLIPLANAAAPLAILIIYEAIFGYCSTIWVISSSTLQQLRAAPEELGRVLGFTRTISLLIIPIGALSGGAFASAIGLVPALILFASVALIGALVSTNLIGSQSTIKNPARTITPVGGKGSQHG